MECHCEYPKPITLEYPKPITFLRDFLLKLSITPVNNLLQHELLALAVCNQQWCKNSSVIPRTTELCGRTTTMWQNYNAQNALQERGEIVVVGE